MRENVHQLRRAYKLRKRHGGPLEAALSAVQVRGRTRTPALVRHHAKVKVDGPVYETWKLGYLIDTIYLRDLWMHRIDAARAVSRPFERSAEHDGCVVADVVAEWARRHGRPFALELTGPASRTYTHEPESPDAERLTLDAIVFCRTLAGRAPATGLLTTVVPF